MRYKIEMFYMVGVVVLASLVIGYAFSRPVEQVAAQDATTVYLPKGGEVVIDIEGYGKIVLSNPEETSTATDTPTDTPVPTETSTDVNTDTPTPTDTETPAPSQTDTPTATATPSAPFTGAPLCDAHDNNTFHTLWGGNCHYDHEHGQSPFTQAIADTFPGFDLESLLGGVQIGHTNPSSPMENTHKHGGFKWQVSVSAPQGCAVGFESGTVAVDAYAIQYHAFGQQSVEFESRNHSSAALLRQCKASNPSDKGYIYVTQLQEYGERVMPYQGMTLPYPDNFQPQYDGVFGPYFTTECFGNDITFNGRFIDCRPTFDNTSNNLSIWTGKRTGPVSQPRPTVSALFRPLIRWRDAYQRLDITDLVHPFTWRFVCGGMTYNPVNCRYNNSTSTIHEIAGNIPSAWDGLAGFDTDPRVGRITAQGFVTRFGTLAPGCTQAGGDCYPIKMVGAFVGLYSSDLCAVKCSNPTPADTPERDIYFCSGSVCSETSPGAVPGGWIGSEN